MKNPEDFNKKIRVVHYTDHETGWPRVNNDLPCDKKPLVESRNGLAHVSFDGHSVATVSMPIHGGARTRFQFFTVENCATPISDFDFKAHFYRSQDDWSSEFSVNESGLMTLYTLILIGFIGLFAAHAFSSFLLYKTLNFLHPILTLFTGALVLQFLSVIFYFIYFNKIRTGGESVKLLDHIGYFFDVLSRGIFLFQLILMARGWSITRIQLNQRLRIVIIMSVYLATALISFGVKTYYYSNRSVTIPTIVHVWDSAVLAFYLFLCGFYIFIALKTHAEENNPVKQNIIRNLGFAYSAYMLICAIASLLAFAIDPWVREKTVESVTGLSTFVAMAYMVHLLWHNKAHTTFDLKVRSVTALADIDYLDVGNTDAPSTHDFHPLEDTA